MQRLKKFWNYWMELDLDPAPWFDRLPPTQQRVLILLFCGMGSALILYAGASSLDLRHPEYGRNHYEISVWERVLFGCFGIVAGVLLGIFTIREIWDLLKSRSGEPLNVRRKRLFRRIKKRFKPINRHHR